MSGTEDYLDGLLNSLDKDAIPQDTETEREPREEVLADAENKKDDINTGEDYLDSLEEDILSGDSTDDFIRQFEEELEQEGMQDAPAGDPLGEDDTLFGSLDDIVNSVKERMQDGDDFLGHDDIMVDTIGDESGIPSMSDAMADISDGMEDEDIVPAEVNPDGFGTEDPEFAELFRTDGELPDIEDLLGSDFGDAGLSGDDSKDLYDGEEPEFPIGSLEEILGMEDEPAKPAEAAEPAAPKETADKEEKKEKKEKKKKEKAEKKEKVDKKAQKKEKGESAGFFHKLSNALFEESDKDGQPAATEEKKTDVSDENLQILQQLEGDMVIDVQQEKKSADDEKAKKKEAAKKAKKEKKEQAKKEREAKKKSKPKKEKKPKQPKEADKSKPLPKKPVFLIFLMTGSFLALVLFGIKYSGYAGSRSRAAGFYARGDYEAAYRELSGLEIADDDKDVFEKYRILANASGEYSAYESFRDAEIHDMALDALIRTVGRCEKYRSDAQAYRCEGELDGVRSRAVAALAEFGVSEERALELYAGADREAYSAELYAILAENGYVME